MALTDKLTNIADAIRSKTGKTDKLTLEQIPIEIAGIESGGGQSLLKEILAQTAEVVEDNSVEIIKSKAFTYNNTIKSVSFPNLIRLHESFMQCTNLENVNFPNLIEITSMRTFSGCGKLKSLVFPKVVCLHGNINFENCTALEFIDFASPINNYREASSQKLPLNYNIGQNAFKGCTLLKTLVIRATDIPWIIANVNCFANSPFAEGGTGGTVYVPAALIEQYKTATNWSALYAAGTCNFIAIEGSEYE